MEHGLVYKFLKKNLGSCTGANSGYQSLLTDFAEHLGLRPLPSRTLIPLYSVYSYMHTNTYTRTHTLTPPHPSYPYIAMDEDDDDMFTEEDMM